LGWNSCAIVDSAFLNSPNGSLVLRVKSITQIPLILFFLLLTFWHSPVRGQEKDAEAILVPTPIAGEPDQVLEESIDPAEYLLGTGDELSIDIWGQTSAHHSLTVTPEGNLLIPGVGRVQVEGEYLADAKELIKQAVLKSYRNAQVTVTLLKLKKIKASVVGAVDTPGVYSVYANTRVSEIIAEAGGFLEDASRRNIMVTHPDGSTGTVDVFGFERTGYRDRNPHVLGGDVIVVPVKDEGMNTIGVYGSVKSGGEFEYAPHDSLLDLIRLAYGLTMDVDLLRAELVRFNPDNQTTETKPVDLRRLVSGNYPHENVPLQPDDRLFIRAIPNFHKKAQVIVRGQVYYPGVYNIEEDQTKLSEVIIRAGGFTPNASLAEAEMIRSYNVVDPEFERLKNIPVADMTESEYDYFRLRSREKEGRVACDFERLFGQGLKAHDVPLKNGDVINIPARSLVINVSGSVINPGLVPYEPDRDYRYYIDRAGGFSWKARKNKILIVKGQTGERARPSNRRRIDPGDTILVPEKPERDYWKFFKDTMLVLGNIATVYLVIDQATR
jgi:protein involved in polysaccharide export with SLBB domain